MSPSAAARQPSVAVVDLPALVDRAGDAWPPRRPPRRRACRRPRASPGARRGRPPRPAARPAARRAYGVERDVVGLGRHGSSASGGSAISAPKIVLTQSMTGATVRKLVVSSTTPPPSGRSGRAAARNVRDVGPAEPVDRLLRVADDEQLARRRPARRPSARCRPRRCAGRRRRCARRARSGSGRCPGTRRAAGAGTAGAARRGRPAPCSGSRSTARASTSRSWNSSWPAARRSSAARSVKPADRRRRALGAGLGDLVAAPRPALVRLADPSLAHR